jgi:AcrR family transcriptional regulator
VGEHIRRTSSRTRETRARLVATAEQLFAQRGVASVSLNEITRAAEQKNRNAVHYHFGSKDGLIQAIFDKHQIPIAAQRSQLLGQINRIEKPTLTDVVTALVQPVAARLEDADGGIAYIKISSQLSAANTLSYFHPEQSSSGISIASWPDMSPLWAPYLKRLPGKVREQRMSLVVGMLFHGLADHALFREQMQPGLGDTQLMVSNLIDSICAVLNAPVSPGTAREVNRLARSRG